MIERINGSTFKQMVLFGAACITNEKQAINDLNVFPVPDGDTGTNMSLTIAAAAAASICNSITAIHIFRNAAEPATISAAAYSTSSTTIRTTTAAATRI